MLLNALGGMMGWVEVRPLPTKTDKKVILARKNGEGYKVYC
jgi:hypothetical protein